MAWRRRPDGGVPEQLARFVPSEWPDAKCPHQALQMWKYACAGWLAEGSTRQPLGRGTERDNLWWQAGDSSRALPFGEWGDAIDVLREARRYAFAMDPCPDAVPPA